MVRRETPLEISMPAFNSIISSWLSFILSIEEIHSSIGNIGIQRETLRQQKLMQISSKYCKVLFTSTLQLHLMQSTNSSNLGITTMRGQKARAHNILGAKQVLLLCYIVAASPSFVYASANLTNGHRSTLSLAHFGIKLAWHLLHHFLYRQNFPQDCCFLGLLD